MSLYRGRSRIELDIEKNRNESNWRKVLDLVYQLNVKNVSNDNLAAFLKNESALEQYLEENAPNEKNTKKAQNNLFDIRTSLNNLLNSNYVKQNQQDIAFESHLLLTKLEFACGHEDRVIFLYDSIDLTTLWNPANASTRSLGLVAELFAIHALSLEKVSLCKMHRLHDGNGNMNHPLSNNLYDENEFEQSSTNLLSAIDRTNKEIVENQIISDLKNSVIYGYTFLQRKYKNIFGSNLQSSVAINNSYNTISGGTPGAAMIPVVQSFSNLATPTNLNIMAGGACTTLHPKEVNQNSAEDALSGNINVATFPSPPPGYILETAFLKLPLCYLKNNAISNAICVYRYLMSIMENKYTQNIREVLGRQFAEVLLKGISASLYKPTPFTIEQIGSQFMKPVEGAKNSQLICSGVYPKLHSYSQQFIPRLMNDEILLLLLICRSLANSAAILSRAPEHEEARKHTLQEITTINDLLTIILTRMAHYKLLAACLERAIKFNIDDTFPWFQYGLSLLASKDFIQARRALEQCHRLDSENVTVVLLLSKICLEGLWNTESGIDYALKAVDLSSDTLSRARAYNALGYGYFCKTRNPELSYTERVKFLELALENFKKALNLDPQNLDFAFNLALQHAALRQLPEATKLVELCLVTELRHAPAAHLLVLLKTSQAFPITTSSSPLVTNIKLQLLQPLPGPSLHPLPHRIESVGESGEEESPDEDNAMPQPKPEDREVEEGGSSTSDPPASLPRDDGADAREGRDDRHNMKQALDLMNNLIQQSPKNFNLLFTKAEIDLRYHGYEEALMTYRNMLTLWKETRDKFIEKESEQVNLVKRAEVKSQMDSYEKEITPSLYGGTGTISSKAEPAVSEYTTFSTAYSVESNKPTEIDILYSIQFQIWLKIAQIYLDQNLLEDAYYSLKEAEEMGKTSHELLDVWGKYYMCLGDSTTAEAYFESSLAINPTYVEALQDLSLAYFYMQNFEMAEIKIKEALKMEPTSHRSWYFLGHIYHTHKDIKGVASDYYFTALDLYTSSPVRPFDVIQPIF